VKQCLYMSMSVVSVIFVLIRSSAFMIIR